MQSSSVISAIARLGDPDDLLDFSHFEKVLSCCTPTLQSRWYACVGTGMAKAGLDANIFIKGYSDPILLKLTITFHTFLSDVATTFSTYPAVNSYVAVQLSSLEIFINFMWTSLRALESDKSDELLKDDSQLAV